MGISLGTPRPGSRSDQGCCRSGFLNRVTSLEQASYILVLTPQARIMHQPRTASNNAKAPAAESKKQAQRLREYKARPTPIKANPQIARANRPRAVIFGAKSFPTRNYLPQSGP